MIKETKPKGGTMEAILKSKIKDLARERNIKNVNRLAKLAALDYKSVAKVWEYDAPMNKTTAITMHHLARALNVRPSALYSVS